MNVIHGDIVYYSLSEVNRRQNSGVFARLKARGESTKSSSYRALHVHPTKRARDRLVSLSSEQRGGKDNLLLAYY